MAREDEKRMRRRALSVLLAGVLTTGLAVTGLTGCGSGQEGKVAVDEAALLDGCTRWQIFTKITLPLSKPIVIYTVLTSFMSPWLDFIFAKVICRANSDQYTIAIGLWKMLEKEYIDSWYTCFAAGAVLISIPIAALFLYMQRYYVDGLSGAVKG